MDARPVEVGILRVCSYCSRFSPSFFVCQNKITIAKSAVVCKGCVLKGNISIGAGTVIHPGCQILALGGPIQIGANNLIEEQVSIINSPNANQGTGQVTLIGSNNSFAVGCTVESVAVGDGNVVEPKAHLKVGTLIPNGCTIGAAVILDPTEVLEDGTTVWGLEHNRRIDANGQKKNTHALKPRLTMLHKILPSSHKLIGAAKAASAP